MQLTGSPIPDGLTLLSREAWRGWLEEHHAQATEVWLTIRKKGSEAPGVCLTDAVEEALCFGWIDGKMRGVDETKFVLRFSPRRERSPWSKINRDRAERLLSEGRVAAAGIEAIARARRDGAWEAAYGATVVSAVPPDLRKGLDGSPTAARNFDGFTDYQRSIYVHWIDDAKRPDTRKRRIRTVVDRAARNIKPGIV